MTAKKSKQIGPRTVEVWIVGSRAQLSGAQLSAPKKRNTSVIKEKNFGHPDLLCKQKIHFREEMRTIGDVKPGIWIIFNHQWTDVEIIIGGGM